METIIHALISSRLDYCNSLFRCLTDATLSSLQLVQNAAARLLTRTNRRSHITPILASLHWLPVRQRIHFKILLITFKALRGSAPNYISELLKPYTTARPLRPSDQDLLLIPRTRLKTRGERAFSSIAPTLWNRLPLQLRLADSVSTFKSLLKTYLFKQAFY